jgi:very-short-patch-repair endonuclease
MLEKERSRQLRKNMTDAEQALWARLRRRQMQGCKFRRQHPLGRYIVDFVCLERKLIVEVDGGQHQEQAGYDDERSQWLEERGYRVLRFWNNQVLSQPDSVLQAIYNALSPPGGPGGLLPRGSHRSERARLRHSARQDTVSLRDHRVNDPRPRERHTLQ